MTTRTFRTCRSRCGWAAPLFGLALLLLPGGLFADIVYLKSGGTIEGKVIDAGTAYRVITKDGELTVPKSQVLKIVPSEDPMTVFDGKFTGIDPKSETAVAAYQALAGWCLENKLPAQERQCHEAAIAIDGDNERSRTALGYEKIGARWLNGDEKMQAKGLVKVDKKWVTPEAREDIQRTAALTQAAEDHKKTAVEAAQATDNLEATRQSLAELIQQAQVETARAKAAELAAVQAQQQLQAVRVDAEIARAQALQALLANQEVLRQIQAEREKLEKLKRGTQPAPTGPAAPAVVPLPPKAVGDAALGTAVP